MVSSEQTRCAVLRGWILFLGHSDILSSCQFQSDPSTLESAGQKRGTACELSLGGLRMILCLGMLEGLELPSHTELTNALILVNLLGINSAKDLLRKSFC